jgi:hypothetical protein
MVRVNVKPLMHWIIYRGYTVRITRREPEQVTGILTTPDGPVTFFYNAARQIVSMPGTQIQINEYGWEIEQQPPPDYDSTR